MAPLRNEFRDLAMQARMLQAQAVLLHRSIKDFEMSVRTGVVMLPTADAEAVARKLRWAAETLSDAAALGKEIA